MRLFFAAAVLAAGTPLIVASAQRSPSAEPMAFEVGTIKPAAGNRGSGGCRGIDSTLAADDPRAGVPLGRFVLTARRLSHLMSIAYGMPLNRMSGCPDWDGPNRSSSSRCSGNSWSMSSSSRCAAKRRTAQSAELPS